MVKVAVWDTDENYLRKEKRLVDQYMRVHGYQYCIESPASEVDLMIIGDAYRIIFVTACQGVHVDETKINAMQNIIKGDAMWDKRIVRCMDDFMQRFIEKTSKLQFAFVEGNKKIYPSDIVYIESCLHRVIFHIKNVSKTYSMYQKLDRTEEILCMYGFCRIHKSFLVNMRYVESIQRYSARLTDEISIQKELSVSQSKYNKVQEEYAKYYDI